MDKVIHDLVEIDKSCSKEVEALNQKKSQFTISLNDLKQKKYNEYLESFKKESNETKSQLEKNMNEQLSLQQKSFEESKQVLEEEYKKNKDQWTQTIFESIINNSL